MKKASPVMTDGGVRMRKAAQAAVPKAKDVIVAEIESHFPEDTPGNEMRQIGALITAATALYADMLHTIINMHRMHGDAGNGKAEATLAVGCVKELLSEPMMQIAHIADGTYTKD